MSNQTERSQMQNNPAKIGKFNAIKCHLLNVSRKLMQINVCQKLSIRKTAKYV